MDPAIELTLNQSFDFPPRVAVVRAPREATAKPRKYRGRIA
jgi:hypothetical protein